jgi:hypothetical protein
LRAGAFTLLRAITQVKRHPNYSFSEHLMPPLPGIAEK